MKPICEAVCQENYSQTTLDLIEDLKNLLPRHEHESLDRLILAIYKEGFYDGTKFINWLEEL